MNILLVEDIEIRTFLAAWAFIVVVLVGTSLHYPYYTYIIHTPTIIKINRKWKKIF